MATEIGAVDRKILRLAAEGLSPEAISKRMGGTISPAKMAIRIQQLVSSPNDYLSIPEQIGLQLGEIRRTYSELRERFLDLDTAKVLLQYSRTILETLDRLQKANEQSVETYSQTVGRAMGAAYDLAFVYLMGAIGDRVPNDELLRIKDEALDVAQAEVIKRQIEA